MIHPMLAEDQVMEMLRSSNNPGVLSATDLLIIAGAFLFAIGISAVVGYVYLKSKRRRNKRNRFSSRGSRSSGRRSANRNSSRHQVNRATGIRAVSDDSTLISPQTEDPEIPPATT